ncbi:MAG: class I SAM-dependent methyltransferase [Nocardioides sp.]|nr:class I SAM-dependent methyltransferase [Nocardioides sp.]
MTRDQGDVEPDTKDWTWVLERHCKECGFDASSFDRHELPHAFRKNAQVWLTLLADPGATERVRPDRWSTLEYACHVHDVHQIFHDRVSSMLAEDTPHFPNWDQDEAAVTGRYADQLPAIIGPTLVAAAYAVADLYASVPALSWGRRGVRSNGSVFTIESLGRYHLHDVVHHLHDVRDAAGRATVRAYDGHADDYAEAEVPLPPAVETAFEQIVSLLSAGSRVLEIGSAGGRDAHAFERAGLGVRRTDVSAGFVERLRSQGYDAAVLDPLTDSLDDPAATGAPYDAVWANASLLHVAREDLGTVLARLAGATRPNGLLYASLKEGDGEGWSIHGPVAAPRFFTYWQEPELRETLERAGWTVRHIRRSRGLRDTEWLLVLASRG